MLQEEYLYDVIILRYRYKKKLHKITKIYNNKEKSLVNNGNYARQINKVESLDERVSNIKNNYNS